MIDVRRALISKQESAFLFCDSHKKRDLNARSDETPKIQPDSMVCNTPRMAEEITDVTEPNPRLSGMVCRSLLRIGTYYE